MITLTMFNRAVGALSEEYDEPGIPVAWFTTESFWRENMLPHQLTNHMSVARAFGDDPRPSFLGYPVNIVPEEFACCIGMPGCVFGVPGKEMIPVCWGEKRTEPL